jgi:hypothetical protein
LLLAEIEDVAVGLGVVEHAVGARKRLNQAVVFEVFIDVESVEVFGIEAGEQDVDHEGDVGLLGVGQVGFGVLLILDALLHVLIVEVEFADAVVAAVLGVVVGDDGLEGVLLLVGLLFVIHLFLRQVFLNLLHVLVALGGRGEDADDVERLEVRVGRLLFGLHGFEKGVIFDGVVDAGDGQYGVELAPGCGGVVLGENGFDDGALGEDLAGLGLLLALGFVVIDMEAQDVAVFDGVGDGVGV